MLQYARFYLSNAEDLEALQRYWPTTIPEHLSQWDPQAIEYAVMYSGHGYPAVWESSGPPKRADWLSLQHARACAFWWSGVADTIGGNADVIHMPTNKSIGRWY